METLDVRRREYTRQRDARVALIRCSECKEYYETSVRQARRIRSGESRRLCVLCRNIEAAHNCTPDQTEEYVRWWLEDSGLPRYEVLEIADHCHPEKARRSELALSPSRRLPDEEGNRPTPTSVLAGPGIRFSVSTINVSTAT